MFFSTTTVLATILLATSTLAAPTTAPCAFVVDSSEVTKFLGACDAQVYWSGGYPPYTGSIIQGRTPSKSIGPLFNDTLSGQSDQTQVTYHAESYFCEIGNVVQFTVKDSRGTVAATKLITITVAPERQG